MDGHLGDYSSSLFLSFSPHIHFTHSYFSFHTYFITHSLSWWLTIHVITLVTISGAQWSVSTGV